MFEFPKIPEIPSDVLAPPSIPNDVFQALKTPNVLSNPVVDNANKAGDIAKRLTTSFTRLQDRSGPLGMDFTSSIDALGKVSSAQSYMNNKLQNIGAQANIVSMADKISAQHGDVIPANCLSIKNTMGTLMDDALSAKFGQLNGLLEQIESMFSGIDFGLPDFDLPDFDLLDGLLTSIKSLSLDIDLSINLESAIFDELLSSLNAISMFDDLKAALDNPCVSALVKSALPDDLTSKIAGIG